MNFLRKIGAEPFVMMIGVAIFLAWLNPSAGAAQVLGINLGDVATWGVAGIFLFYGMRLDRKKLSAGLSNIRLHVLIHCATFIMFPLIVLAAMYACGAFEARGDLRYLWLGTFFLATLPSTVSSSVVMVSIAGGNMPAAIFNASISSLMGVFITPVWMSLFLDNVEGSHGLGEVILKLVVQVIVPVIAGLLLNPKFGKFAQDHRKVLRNFDQSVILLIIYTSFCESFLKKMFSGFPLGDLIVLAGCMVGLFITAMLIVYGLCRIMGFDRDDTVTAVFCGSKKSLVHGSVMSRVLFSNPAVIGVVLLPTMLYHAFQLILISVIARKAGAAKEAAEKIK